MLQYDVLSDVIAFHQSNSTVDKSKSDDFTHAPKMPPISSFFVGLGCAQQGESRNQIKCTLEHVGGMLLS